MYRLYESQDVIEAQLLVDYLASSHILATLLGHYQTGAAGELSAQNFPGVWLFEARDRARAEALLQEFLQHREKSPGGEAWQCPQCGTTLEASFDLCWQCGTGRPL